LVQKDNKKGFIFIFNGWGSGDHIDLWDGTELRAGDDTWVDRGGNYGFGR